MCLNKKFVLRQCLVCTLLEVVGTVTGGTVIEPPSTKLCGA